MKLCALKTPIVFYSEQINSLTLNEKTFTLDDTWHDNGSQEQALPQQHRRVGIILTDTPSSSQMPAEPFPLTCPQWLLVLSSSLVLPEISLLFSGLAFLSVHLI